MKRQEYSTRQCRWQNRTDNELVMQVSIHRARMKRLQVKLEATATQTDDFDTLLKQGLGNLFRLSEIYEKGSIVEKRRVIGSVYPEKLTFDGDQLRTNRINKAVRLIYTLDKGLPEK
jgi:site-specific DNA recombinase